MIVVVLVIYEFLDRTAIDKLLRLVSQQSENLYIIDFIV